MLKADLHLHCKGDPYDTYIRYTWKQIINKAKKHNFDVLSITLHNKVLYTQEMQDYAKERNILLIPGTELSLNNKHILLYNITEEQRKKIKTFNDLKQARKEGVLIFAAHPFLPIEGALQNKLYKYKDLFHGVDINHFYRIWLNPHKKTIRFARKHNKTLLGNTDLHHLWTFNYTYTLIHAKKTTQAVLSALKKGHTKIHTKPLPFHLFIRESLHICYSMVKWKIKNFL